MPLTAGAAPGRTRSPASFKYLEATAADIADVQTLCFHIMSAFFINSGSQIQY